MFPKKERISRKDFSSIYKKGKSFHFPNFTFRVSLREDKGQKFSVVLGGAWQKKKSLRNKTKRRVAHILKNRKEFFPENVNIICFIKKEASSLSYKTISERIKENVLSMKKSFPRSSK
ncbi:MAG: ribonuclease P protein component [Patescibacteria group bacterium]